MRIAGGGVGVLPEDDGPHPVERRGVQGGEDLRRRRADHGAFAEPLVETIGEPRRGTVLKEWQLRPAMPRLGDELRHGVAIGADQFCCPYPCW